MKNSISRLMLAAIMILGLSHQVHAQKHHPNPYASLTEYMVQVRVNPTNRFAAHFRGPVVNVDRLSYHFTEFDTEQQALNWAANNPDYLLLGVYPVDPAPAAWETVQVETSYNNAVDAWYEIVGNTDGLEVQIKSRPITASLNTLIGGSMFDYVNSASSGNSISVTDYYYDFEVKIKLDRRSIGYLIDTNSRSNPVILKTFQSQADYQNYMNLHSYYELIESQSYSTLSGYTAEAFHVRTADTLAEAQDIMDFIEDENLYSSFQFSLGYFWNP